MAVLSYEDKNYKQEKVIYDALAQVFEDLKRGRSQGGWNLPAEHIAGLTMRFLGEGCLELTYHHYEVTTVEGLERCKDDGSKFVGEVVKELKKNFKKATGATLSLKKLKDNKVIDKVSRVTAETSWMLGSSRYGHGARPVGRYLVRDSGVYEFGADLE